MFLLNIEKKEVAEFWMEDLLLIVTPNSLSIKNTNNNESTQSVDGTPITIPKRDKAQTFTLSFMIPYLLQNHQDTYWIHHNSNIRTVKDFTDFIWTVKWNRTPIKLTISYTDESSINGEFLLDDYEYTQDATNGSDYEFNLTLTEYYPAKNYEVSGQLVNSLIEQGIRNPRRLD